MKIRKRKTKRVVRALWCGKDNSTGTVLGPNGEFLAAIGKIGGVQKKAYPLGSRYKGFVLALYTGLFIHNRCSGCKAANLFMPGSDYLCATTICRAPSRDKTVQWVKKPVV